MKLTKLVCAAMVAAMGIGSTAGAQSLRQAQTPAEFPSSSYKGNQYVDSRGCVYIRAGIDGNVTWVPRVSRERRPVCGLEPTQITSAPEVAAEVHSVEQITLDTPVVVEAPKPVVAAAPVVEPKKTAAVTPRPKRMPAVRKVKTRAAPTETVASQIGTPAPKVAAPAPARVAVAAPVVVAAKPAPVATPRKANPSNAVCTGASTTSNRYINTARKGLVVRCGPQRISPATPLAQGTEGEMRVVPSNVARRRASNEAFKLPAGYRAAWEDDRLNPKRAEGTLQGWGQMNLVWSNTVPRRLIDSSSGRDVTGDVALVYPFTDVETQQDELGEVTFASRNGQKVKRILRKPGAPTVAELAARPSPVVASRSTPAAAPKAAVRAKPKAPVAKARQGETLAGKRYVQVGTFGVPANAQATASKLKRFGLPVRIGKVTRGDKTYRLVLSGPFVDDETAERALRAARKAGFPDAYLRR
ncbi:MAG: SPOR domain-containing protein [Aliishimia sp.]